LEVNSKVFPNKESIKKVEDKYKATYIGDFSPKAKNGDWVNTPMAVFYQENPPENYSNYFGIYWDNEHLMITEADYIKDLKFTGAKADNGEIIYSFYRHDYKYSADGSVMVDGGFDYLRTNDVNRLVSLQVVKDKIVEIENGN